MTKIVDATENIGPRTIVADTVMTVANRDPISDPASSTRVNQQQLIPPAVQNRFLNTVVAQTPVPIVVTAVTPNDLRDTTGHTGDGITTSPAVLFGFGYTGSSQGFLQVELCLSIFIDTTDLFNAYPIGANVSLSHWNITRIKSAHRFVSAANSPSGQNTYNPNQANQDFEWLLVEHSGSANEHDVIVEFYWRAIQNTGGGTPTTT